MDQKCYICNIGVKKGVKSIKSEWNGYRLTVRDVDVTICPKCGETFIGKENATMIQALNKALSDMGNPTKSNIINLRTVKYLINHKNRTISEIAQSPAMEIMNENKKSVSDYKVEIWINEDDSRMDICIRNINDSEDYTIVDTSIIIEDETQAERIRDSYEFLGYDVLIKYISSEED